VLMHECYERGNLSYGVKLKLLVFSLYKYYTVGLNFMKSMFLKEVSYAHQGCIYLKHMIFSSHYSHDLTMMMI